MFAALEITKGHETHLCSDVDYNLRRTIYELFLIAFISRRRVLWYKMKDNEPNASNDIRLCDDILFILDHIYRRSMNDEGPLLALFYFNMSLISDDSYQSATNELQKIIRRELDIQMMQISRKCGAKDATDGRIINVWDNVETLAVMRKFLQYNSKKMTNESQRHSFPVP
ncbi:unnamed protein product [Rotaria sp. Silwood2]|nr:unnamed protein product [Rotaria sp. Silwood2]CAF4357742.1 unnamed protein product [Rotaria sp. Silwood2]